jgi:hypothetical protein
MDSFFRRYMQGDYQNVYNEIIALGEQIFSFPSLQDDTIEVTKEIMRRARFNLESILIPRLHTLGYRFGDGLEDYPDNLPSEELALIQRDHPVFLPPVPTTAMWLEELDQMTGGLPLSLRYWYEEVGQVNLIGSFPSSLIQCEREFQDYKGGYPLDPLSINSLEEVRALVEHQKSEAVWEEEPVIPLSLDGDFKFGYSGSGEYGIMVPCRAMDGDLLLEPHATTFINYLRLCIRRGGFPGLGEYCTLQEEAFVYLTKDLIDF